MLKVHVKEEIVDEETVVKEELTHDSSITQRCLKSESTDESEDTVECPCEECSGDAWVQGENGHLIKVKLEENEAVHHQQRETEPKDSPGVSLSLPADCLDAFFPDDPTDGNEGNPVQGPGRPTSSSSASYLCPVCGRGFKSKAGCVQHGQTHEPGRARAYTCARCGKGFYTRQILVKHERVHQVERPFPCPTCGRGFTQKGNCLKHQRTHDPERARPHVCAVCGAGYQAARGLRLHEKKHRKSCK